MKIIDAGTQHLPNGIVLAHINALQKSYEAQERSGTIPENLKAILRDTRTNLTRSSAAASAGERAPTAETKQPGETTVSKAAIAALTQKLTDRFKLLPGEVLMVLNHRPVAREELAGLIEELDDRMDEKRQVELLRAVRKCFGGL